LAAFEKGIRKKSSKGGKLTREVRLYRTEREERQHLERIM
jgi:hypothetical protein